MRPSDPYRRRSTTKPPASQPKSRPDSPPRTIERQSPPLDPERLFAEAGRFTNRDEAVAASRQPPGRRLHERVRRNGRPSPQIAASRARRTTRRCRRSRQHERAAAWARREAVAQRCDELIPAPLPVGSRLLRLQRLHRIDRRRASRRQVARERRRRKNHGEAPRHTPSRSGGSMPNSSDDMRRVTRAPRRARREAHAPQREAVPQEHLRARRCGCAPSASRMPISRAIAAKRRTRSRRRCRACRARAPSSPRSRASRA